MSNDYGSGNITALFGKPFDPNEHEPSSDFKVLTPGDYTCLIESAELKTTEKGTGKLVKVTLGVIEGQSKGRKLFDYINLQNPSEDCQRMGIAQLSALGRAAGVYPVSDTADIVDKVVVAVVKVKKRKDTGQDQNDVCTYKTNPGMYISGVTAPAEYSPPVAPPPSPLTYTAPTPTQVADPVGASPVTPPAYTPPAPAVNMPTAVADGDAPWKR